MGELDLSKAVEAIRETASTFTALDDAECAAIARAALPHILDALAEQAEAGRDAIIEADPGFAKSIFYTLANRGHELCRQDLAASWLRAKAEEMRA